MLVLHKGKVRGSQHSSCTLPICAICVTLTLKRSLRIEVHKRPVPTKINVYIGDARIFYSFLYCLYTSSVVRSPSAFTITFSWVNFGGEVLLAEVIRASSRSWATRGACSVCSSAVPVGPCVFVCNINVKLCDLFIVLASPLRPSRSVATEVFEQHQGTHILQSLDGFAFVLAADGRFLYISETVSIYLGLSQVEMTGSTIFDYVHQHDHAEVSEQLGLSAGNVGHSPPPPPPSSTANSDDGSCDRPGNYIYRYICYISSFLTPLISFQSFFPWVSFRCHPQPSSRLRIIL